MKQNIYQVDAFAETIFTGNPAAVCPLTEWLDDATMQSIAMENNLAETAFYVRQDDEYEIRLFTPTVEVDLCGHATLASAFVLFNIEGYAQATIDFRSRQSGKLSVSRRGDLLVLNFPADTFTQVAASEQLLAGFRLKPIAAFKGKTDYMLVFESEQDIRTLNPQMAEIAKLDARGVIVTAKGSVTDFVSRFFAPAAGVNEDPVTGSAHTTLIPYWADKLGKETLTALQLSKRSGLVECKYLGDRVEIGGRAKLYLEGQIHI